MSQPQIQQRPTGTNGLGRRKSDRDVGSARGDSALRSDAQNWRSSHASSRSRSGGTATGASAHIPGHFVSKSNSVGGLRSFGDRAEAGVTSVSRGAALLGRPFHDRLHFMAMCLIGQPVEVQAKNGLFYSGIFHTVNVENDFDVVLKMAQLIRDGSAKGAQYEVVKEGRTAPQETLIIHAKDFVQIIAKDVSLSGDALPNGRARENKADIVTDAILSQGRQRDVERELKPWKPDDEAPRPLGLELTFQSSWNRNWDQFETNKTLFGVETTFNEELYTTRLERGPQTREREREASRIAREIEGTASKNLYQAEERAIRLSSEIEIMDEESRFSSVIRSMEKADVGEDGNDKGIDERNVETFGSSFMSVGGGRASPSGSNASTTLTADSESKSSRPSSADSTQNIDGPLQKDPSILLQERRTSSIEKGELALLDSQADTHTEHLRLRDLLVGDKSKRSSKAGGSPYQSPVGRGSPLLSPRIGDSSIQALNLHPSCPQVSDEVRRKFHEFKLQKTAKKQREDEVNELKSFSKSLKKKEFEPRSPRAMPKVLVGDAVGLSKHVPQEGGPTGQSWLVDSKPGVSPCVQAVLSSGAADFGNPSTLVVSSVSASHPASPAVSPSSSVLSPGPKKCPLNPNAKEFKLNPNAKAFTPTFALPRSPNPMIQGQGGFIPSVLPRAAQIPGIPFVGMSGGQYMQHPQPGQPSQFTQYNSAMAAAAANSPQSVQPAPQTGYVPGNGISQVLSGQAGLKVHQQQSQQQQGRYTPPCHPMHPQAAYGHSNGQLYPQHMYAQQQVLYVHQYSQGMMHGQPVPPQGQLSTQPSNQSQQKHRGGIQQMNYPSGPPSYLPGQHHLPQSQLSHHSLQAAPGGLPPSMPIVQLSQQAMLNPKGNGGSGDGGTGRGEGGKGETGNFSRQ